MDSKELRLFREAYGSIFEGYSKNKKEKECVDKEESEMEDSEMEEGGEKEEYKGKKKEKKEMEESVSDSAKDVTASERLDEAEGPALPGEPGRPGTPKAPGGRPHLPGEKQTPAPKKPGMTLQLAGADLFDIVKGHLMSEGYADTEEAAIAIMANMSEEWKQDIVEAKYGTKEGRKRLAKKIRKGEEIGKSGPGTGFAAVEKAAKEGGARDPKAVAAAAMWKTHGGKKG
jgi:hypothetical protein